MKKIGLLIPNLAKGGAERVVSRMSLELSKVVDLKIILFDKCRIDYPYKGEIIDLGIKLPDDRLRMSRNPFSRPLDKLKYNLFYIKAFFILTQRLKKIKKKHNFDVVVSFLVLSDLINVASKHKEKTIVSARSITSEKINGFSGHIKKQIIKFFYKKADLIVALSKLVKRDLIEKFGLNDSKVKTIYNHYGIQEIRKLSREKLERKYRNIFKNPALINSGRLTYQKGQWHLIRAFKKVKEKIPTAQLVILGEGELGNYLKSLSKESGLEKDINFLGFQKNPFKFIKNSDIFVFPSLYEGFGNVIVESMACDKPIISSDCRAGPREILSQNTDINYETKKAEYAEYGVLIPVCDGKKRNANEKLTKEEEILAEQIILMFKERELRERYSKKSRERVKDFKTKKIIKEWIKIIS